MILCHMNHELELDPYYEIFIYDLELLSPVDEELLELGIRLSVGVRR